MKVNDLLLIHFNFSEQHLTHATVHTCVNLAFCQRCICFESCISVTFYLKLSTLNAFKLRLKLQLCRAIVLHRPLRCLTFLLAMLAKPVSPRKGTPSQHPKSPFSDGRAPPPGKAKPGAPPPPPPPKAASAEQAKCRDAVNERLSAASWNLEAKAMKRRRTTKQEIANADEGFILSYNTTKPNIELYVPTFSNNN